MRIPLVLIARVMIIAKKKKEENIAEYILYMWQVEDLIRACNFDISVISKNIIDRFDQPADVRSEMVKWYENLIEMMHNENVEHGGHVSVLKAVVEDVNDFHIRLMQEPKEMQYNSIFFQTLPCLVEIRNNTRAGESVSDVELALNTLYGVLLLRLQKKEISKATEEAVGQISKFLSVLSKKYKEED